MQFEFVLLALQPNKIQKSDNFTTFEKIHCWFINKLKSDLFKDKVYNQIDRAAMDSPLAAILANISMSFYKSKWLNEYNINKTKFYLRYVDDILDVFEK